MNFYAISALVNLLISILLCLAVLSKSNRSKLDILFVYLSLSSCFWSFGYFAWQISSDYSSALFWSRFFMGGAIGIGALYLHFIVEFLNLSDQKKVFLRLADIFFTIFFFLNFTSLMVNRMEPELQFQFWPKPGLAFHFFLTFWFICVVYATILLYKGYRKAVGVLRNQLRLLLWGLLIAFSGGSVNYFLWYGIDAPPVTNILVSIYFLFVFLAIIRYKFFNVKIITTELFVLFLLSVNIWQFFISEATFNVYLSVLLIILTLVMGALLIKSVLKEVEQREQLQELSNKLAEANEQLQELDKAKSEFLSVTSHQLRTPLTAIKGYASMFLEGDFGKLNNEQKTNIQTIYESAQRLVNLIADLLDLSRIESGRMEFDFRAVDLCKMVNDVFVELQPKALGKKIYLFFDNVNRSCPEIRADEEKLRQVVVNLIDNAIKYTIHGGVTVRLIKIGKELEFNVIDTGIGVDPKDHDKLFQQFFRTDAANEVTREGTGLGIYVVKKIVEAHGGKIWFESPGLNKGTTFKVRFPIPDGPISEERVKISSLQAF